MRTIICITSFEVFHSHNPALLSPGAKPDGIAVKWVHTGASMQGTSTVVMDLVQSTNPSSQLNIFDRIALVGMPFLGCLYTLLL